METHKLDIFQKSSNFDCVEELKSPELHQYQSYISSWYINGKVF